MSELDVSHAQVRYGHAVAVRDFSLLVPSGGSVGIVGESGSGKTTIARAIVGQLPLAAGSIRIDGVPLSRRERHRVQLLPQDPFSSLNPRMTVTQTISELLAVHRLVPRAQRRARVAELLEQVRLDPALMRAYPHELSGGQRQRVALARALAVEPAVLVADEPTSALDVSVQATIVELLRGMQRELGVTLVIISHDLGVVYELCDEVTVMRRGEVVEQGTRELFRAPVHAYSRELLAAVPRLPGR